MLVMVVMQIYLSEAHNKQNSICLRALASNLDAAATTLIEHQAVKSSSGTSIWRDLVGIQSTYRRCDLGGLRIWRPARLQTCIRILLFYAFRAFGREFLRVKFRGADRYHTCAVLCGFDCHFANFEVQIIKSKNVFAPGQTDPCLSSQLT